LDTSAAQNKEDIAMAVRKTDTAMAEKPTNQQAQDLRQVAIDKGVTRILWQKGAGTLALALDAIKLGRPIAIRPEFVVPEGWRTHVLDNVLVAQDEDWGLAINNAGPNTPADCNVRKVGHLYLPTGTGTKNCRLLLVHNNCAGWNSALAWAKQYPQLKPTAPRHVFAVGEHHPKLNKKLKCDPMHAIATTECSFAGVRLTCRVWWVVTNRGARLHPVSDLAFGGVWFVFLCLPDQPGPRASVFSEPSTQ
jgi:hypothetical protein